MERERDFNLFFRCFGNTVHLTFMPIKRIIEIKKRDTKTEREKDKCFIYLYTQDEGELYNEKPGHKNRQQNINILTLI